MSALIVAVVLFAGAGLVAGVCDCWERAQRNRAAHRRPRCAQVTPNNVITYRKQAQP